MVFPIELIQKMTLTGILLFALGVLTMIPEIYLSGIIVMAISASLHINDLEVKRIDEQHPAPAPAPAAQPATTHFNYESW